MPELPEVETIRRDLAAHLRGKQIARVELRDRRVLEGFGPDGGVRRHVSPARFEAALAGRRVREIFRRGKYLVFDFGAGPALLAHLRMTGRLVWGPPDPAARARLIFAGEGNVLNFSDTRRFGELWLSEDWTRDPAVAALGPEPLDAGWNIADWGKSLRRSSCRMQAALLDQRRIAGLGNIYVTEALFRSGLRPTRRARSLAARDIPGLAEHIRDVLKEGLAHRGVSFRDYRDAHGERGRARERLQVYGKAGLPCPRCGAAFRGVKVNGRGAVYCPRCQK